MPSPPPPSPDAPSPTQGAVLAALREVLDPEIGIDVVDLGLIHTIRIDGGAVRVTMGVTSPTCPLGPHMAEEAEGAVSRLPGVASVTVEIVHDPPWSPERMSEAARRRLGW